MAGLLIVMWHSCRTARLQEMTLIFRIWHLLQCRAVKAWILRRFLTFLFFFCFFLRFTSVRHALVANKCPGLICDMHVTKHKCCQEYWPRASTPYIVSLFELLKMVFNHFALVAKWVFFLAYCIVGLRGLTFQLCHMFSMYAALDLKLSLNGL